MMLHPLKPLRTFGPSIWIDRIDAIAGKDPNVESRLLEALAHGHDFWNHTRDGLAVLSAPGVFQVFRFQRPVAATYRY